MSSCLQPDERGTKNQNNLVPSRDAMQVISPPRILHAPGMSIIMQNESGVSTTSAGIAARRRLLAVVLWPPDSIL